MKNTSLEVIERKRFESTLKNIYATIPGTKTADVEIVVNWTEDNPKYWDSHDKVKIMLDGKEIGVMDTSKNSLKATIKEFVKKFL